MPLRTNGGKIRELRERQALTTTELAKQMGTTPSYLRKVENNYRNGGKAFVRSAAQALGVEISAITDYVPVAEMRTEAEAS